MDMRVILEDAVSPVIGVMLMITVTIIVAAVVAAFVGGASTQFEKTPQASLRVYCDGSEEEFNIIFEHLSGDPLRTEDLRIVTWIKDGDEVIKNETSARSGTVVDEVRYPRVYDVQQPDQERQGFGEAIWKRGTRAGTYDREKTAMFLGIVTGEGSADINKLDGLIQAGTPVEVTVIHIPSGNTILRNEFILE
ncbi:type IV pilin N-terminal domain-containing protein [Methanoculleus sp. UBA331]|jgi:FlaG/FlaF family flagellin (archaellin)|uniref:type IV pilin N-terminal domain-containing protein n=2 Tax=Methanoculleus TaxID=45989 RepID=UPI00319D905C